MVVWRGDLQSGWLEGEWHRDWGCYGKRRDGEGPAAFNREVIEHREDGHIKQHSSQDIVLDEGKEMVIWGEGEDDWGDWAVESG